MISVWFQYGFNFSVRKIKILEDRILREEYRIGILSAKGRILFVYDGEFYFKSFSYSQNRILKHVDILAVLDH